MGRAYLDQYAPMSDPRYSYTYPGGADDASWDWAAPKGADPPVASVGSTVVLRPAPASWWSGVLDQPEPGDPWTMRATGIAKMAQRFVAVADDGHPDVGNHVDEGVDNAIADGLPWTRAVSLPNAEGPIPSGSMNVYDLLDTVAADRGEYWTVDDYGYVTIGPAPTVPTYLLVAEQIPGPTYDGFVTGLVLTYYDEDDLVNHVIKVTNAAVVARYGTQIQAPLDLTSRGAMSAAQATSIGNGRLARQSLRPHWSEPFVAAPGQLLNMGGVPVDLATVRPGCLILPRMIDRGRSANFDPGSPTDALISMTDYDGTQMTLTPVGTPGNTLVDLLASAS